MAKLDVDDREKLSKKYKTSQFKAGKQTVKNWVRIEIDDLVDVKKILPFVTISYETVLEK
jgi:hypothetical protein